MSPALAAARIRAYLAAEASGEARWLWIDPASGWGRTDPASGWRRRTPLLALLSPAVVEYRYPGACETALMPTWAAWLVQGADDHAPHDRESRRALLAHLAVVLEGAPTPERWEAARAAHVERCLALAEGRLLAEPPNAEAAAHLVAARTGRPYREARDAVDVAVLAVRALDAAMGVLRTAESGVSHAAAASAWRAAVDELGWWSPEDAERLPSPTAGAAVIAAARRAAGVVEAAARVALATADTERAPADLAFGAARWTDWRGEEAHWARLLAALWTDLRAT